MPDNTFASLKENPELFEKNLRALFNVLPLRVKALFATLGYATQEDKNEFIFTFSYETFLLLRGVLNELGRNLNLNYSIEDLRHLIANAERDSVGMQYLLGSLDYMKGNEDAEDKVLNVLREGHNSILELKGTLIPNEITLHLKDKGYFKSDDELVFKNKYLKTLAEPLFDKTMEIVSNKMGRKFNFETIMQDNTRELEDIVRDFDLDDNERNVLMDIIKKFEEEHASGIDQTKVKQPDTLESLEITLSGVTRLQLIKLAEDLGFELNNLDEEQRNILLDSAYNKMITQKREDLENVGLNPDNDTSIDAIKARIEMTLNILVNEIISGRRDEFLNNREFIGSLLDKIRNISSSLNSLKGGKDKYEEILKMKDMLFSIKDKVLDQNDQVLVYTLLSQMTFLRRNGLKFEDFKITDAASLDSYLQIAFPTEYKERYRKPQVMVS